MFFTSSDSIIYLHQSCVSFSCFYQHCYFLEAIADIAAKPAALLALHVQKTKPEQLTDSYCFTSFTFLQLKFSFCSEATVSVRVVTCFISSL